MKHTAILSLIFLSLLFSCKTEKAASDEQAVIESILSSQKAGFIDHDLKAYLAVWADDAKLIGPRKGENPHNIVLDRKQIEETKKLRFAGPKPEMTMSIENEKVERTDQGLRLSWRLSAKGPGFIEVTDEEYDLRKEGDAWLITENRYWLVESGEPGKLVAHDAAYWAGLDQEVDKARRLGDEDRLVYALFDASRFQEAHELAKGLSEDRPESIDIWSLRADLAVFAGDTQDAQVAACHVRKLGGAVVHMVLMRAKCE